MGGYFQRSLPAHETLVRREIREDQEGQAFFIMRAFPDRCRETIIKYSCTSFFEHEINCCQYAYKRDEVVPPQRLLQIKNGKKAEDDQGDHLLYHLELKAIEAFYKSDPVGRHLEAVFEKSNGPTHKDDFPQ